ncbi:MAG TPA: PAS domain S-box protein [Sphingobacteriaceae bacterium]|nr:PAS domain S-box protein [Sphingobacteriaceae bacterium]
MDSLSNTVLQNLLESLPGMLYRCKNDKDWTMLYVSHGSLDLTGYLPEELLNNNLITFNELICETDRERIWNSISESLKARTNLNNEYRIKTREKEVKWVKEIANGVYDDDNNLLYIEGYITDITKAKNQEQLKTAKDFYESIIDNINIDIAVFDMDNRYRLISKSAVNDDELREWMIGKNDFEYCIKRNKDISLAHERTSRYSMVNETNKPLEWIEEVKDHARASKYFVRIIKPFKDLKGKPYKVGYGLDITRLKNAENELIQREQLLNFSHSLAKIGYWVVDFETEKAEWSQGIYEISELDKATDKPSLRLFYSMIHPDDIELVKETNQKSQRENHPFLIEYRIILKNGDIKYIKEESPGRISDRYRFAVLQDVTKIRLSEEALAASEKHFKAIAENSPILIAEINSKNQFTYLNRALGDVDMADVINRSVFDYIPETQHSTLSSHIARVKDTQQAVDLEIEGIVDGHKVWFHLIIGPLTGTGDAGTLLLLAQDVTEKKMHEHDREKLIKEINNRYNELMQFNYIVSHNLRSPVANILGIAYLYKEETDEAEKEHMFDYIVQSAESIDQLIKDLNDVLAIRSPLNEKIEKLRLSEIVTIVLNNLEKQIQDSNTLIKVNIEPDADELYCIKSYLQSTILNLLSNAIKYKSELRPAEITISSIKTTQAIVITIADNGMGMDLKSYGSQIFGLYKRFHTHIEGKGLGLHMTKMQVEALGGTISVVSEPDKGSIFTIIFPLIKK